ncbi:unnamed protein product, partial [Rotaria magnacalcarata]
MVNDNYATSILDIPSFLKSVGLKYFQRPPKVERPFIFFGLFINQFLILPGRTFRPPDP